MYDLKTITEINKTKCAIFVDGRTAWDHGHRCKIPATLHRIDNGDANICHVHFKDIPESERHLFSKTA